jgi:tetratricopeptide (TPR) repeat protein
MVNKARWIQLKQEASAARRSGDFDRALELFEAAVEEVKEHTHDLADLCLTNNSLAALLADRGELEKSIELARSIVATRRTFAGEFDGLLGNDLMFLAMVLEEAGRCEEALPFAEEGAKIYVAQMGADHYEAKRMQGVMERIRAAATDAKRPAAGAAS